MGANERPPVGAALRIIARTCPYQDLRQWRRVVVKREVEQGLHCLPHNYFSARRCHQF